jgi:outer membrane protein OmpA-like peptidoglycan-associated protein
MPHAGAPPVAALLVAVALAAGCTDGDPGAVAVTPAPPAPPAGADQAEGDVAPSRVAVEVFTEVSSVTTGAADVGVSSVEVRVAELLSELEAAPTDEGDLVTLPEDVLFDFDSATLKPEASATLDRLAEAAVLAQDRPVDIRGHTDARGDDGYNLDLSRRRAEAVRDHLAGRGVDLARMTAEGFGETRPVAANEGPGGVDDPAGRQRNRRVEVLLGPPG